MPYNGFILLILYMLFVVPSAVFHYNSEEFYSSLLKYYWAAAGITIVLLLSAYLLRKAFPKSLKILNSTCIVIGLYIFIVNFIFPLDTGLLDGVNNETNELLTKKSILQTLGYLLLIAGITSLFKLQAKIINELINIAIFVGVAWIVYIAFTSENFHIQEATQVEQNQLVENHYALSEKKNILVVQLDALQGNFVYEILKENPEYKHLFDGFTFFANTNSVSPATTLSVPIILGGKLSAENYYNTQQDTFEDNFLRDAINSGFTASTFNIDCRYSPANCVSVHGKAIKNILSANSNDKSRLFYISLMRYIPTSLLSLFTHSVNPQRSNIDIKKAALKGTHYPLELDYLSLQEFIDNIFVDDSQPKAFKYQMHIFTHTPMIFDKKCAFIGKQEMDKNSAKEVTTCGLTSFIQLINKLKSLKIYDNTSIILLSDHGHEKYFNNESQLQPHNSKPYFAATLDVKDAPHSASRYYATIFYKDFNSQGDLKINNDPVSLLDIRATLCPHLSNCNPSALSGSSLNNVPSPNRKRPVLMYLDGLNRDGYKQFESYRYLTLEDHISELPYVLADLAPIRFSDTLDFTGKDELPLLYNNLIGIGSGNTWTKDKLVDIAFKIDSKIKQKGVILNLKVDRAYISKKHPNLSVKLFINNQQLATSTFDYLSNTNKGTEITLDIPSMLVQDDDYLYLRLEIDNPISPFELGESKNKNKLGLSLSMITLLEPESKPPI